MTFPAGLKKHGETKVFTAETVPAALLSQHDTKPGVWGKLMVLDGALDYVLTGPPEVAQRVEAGGFAVIEPTVLHRVGLVGPVSFKVEFHSVPKAEG
ncbi:MAG: DUF1971 domain-containing protein [Minwuia sp.]|nr:DUF1971 domain-containing protein [Minwuia sp.]